MQMSALEGSRYRGIDAAIHKTRRKNPWKLKKEMKLDEFISRNVYIFPMISIRPRQIFESGNWNFGTKIGIKRLRKVGKYFTIARYKCKYYFTQFHGIFYLLSRSNFTQDARDERISDFPFSILLFYLKIIFYFRIS